jgi:hypothetical protein
VQDQRAHIGFQQKVLGASPRAANGAARNQRTDGAIDGPAQSPIMNQQAIDAATDDVRLDAAARRLNFR